MHSASTTSPTITDQTAPKMEGQTLRDNPRNDGFTVGGNLAATPGKVIFRDALMELIQYAPATATLGAEPVLIVPPWDMKYYILDLSSANSLILWLVHQGRTVFVISWRNPGADLLDTSLEDYRVLGVMAAIGVVSDICGDARIHAAGYCLGGTLLSIAAAAMARDDDDRLASLSLFAAQTDFTEVGELQLFITEEQLDVLSDITQAQGYLDSAQMSGMFRMSHANDLVWNGAIREYLLGEHDGPNDLAAWNADGPRLPPRMHIEYLRRLFLHNDLAEGRFRVAGRRLMLRDMDLPMFVVGAERDQVARWRSVFKLHFLNDGQLTFVLTLVATMPASSASPDEPTGTSASVSARPEPGRLARMNGNAGRSAETGPGGWRWANGLTDTRQESLSGRGRWVRPGSRRFATHPALMSAKPDVGEALHQRSLDRRSYE